MSDVISKRDTVEFWLKAYGVACICRNVCYKQGAKAEADEHEKDARQLERLILDAVDEVAQDGEVPSIRAVLTDGFIEQATGEVFRRLYKAAGYDDPGNIGGHVITPTMAQMCMRNVLQEARRGKLDECVTDGTQPAFASSVATDDITWAMDRLKVLATTGDDRYEQAHACETIVRCVRVLAGCDE